MSRLPQDETGKPERGYDYDFGMEAVAVYVDDGAGGVELWDGNVTVAGDVLLAVDELENLVQAAPVDRSNASFALTYTGSNLTQIDMTVEGTVFRRTLTYSGSTLTGVSLWVEQ